MKAIYFVAHELRKINSTPNCYWNFATKVWEFYSKQYNQMYLNINQERYGCKYNPCNKRNIFIFYLAFLNNQ